MASSSDSSGPSDGLRTTSPSLTPIDRISNDHVQRIAQLSPIMATYMGRPGLDDRLDDLSPAGHAARLDTLVSTRVAALAVGSVGPADELARDVLVERIDVQIEEHESGWVLAKLNTIDSPLQYLRMVFDMMPTATLDDRLTMKARMAAVPAALAGYRESLLAAAAKGQVSAVRQLRRSAGQCRTYAGATGDRRGYFSTKVSEFDDGATMVDQAAAAERAFAAFADFLDHELIASAPELDAVGVERYRVGSREHLGATIDLAETYAWGWQEFLHLQAELTAVVHAIAPGADAATAARRLDDSPKYQVRGTEGLREWMQELSDRSLAELGRTHFSVEGPVQQLDCKIAPAGGSLGAYYFGPSDDFSRPGSMWFSVDHEREVFPVWRDTSTVFHEGVPGHHLQIATAVLRRDRLNDFQRLLAETSGHCEGWALYAERLMRELGYLDDEGDLLGHLNSQLFRAARVVIDIGMHLQLPIPDGVAFHDGESWTPALGLEFLTTRTLLEAEEASDEIDRYLGWPGQAPAYKVGERIWLQARDGARARHGAAFDPKEFHTAALSLGNMGLAPLGAALAAL